MKERDINLLLSMRPGGFENYIKVIVGHSGSTEMGDLKLDSSALLCITANLMCNFMCNEVSTIPNNAKYFTTKNKKLIQSNFFTESFGDTTEVIKSLNWFTLDRCNRILATLNRLKCIEPAFKNKATKVCPISKYMIIGGGVIETLLDRCLDSPVFDLRTGPIDYDFIFGESDGL